MLCVHANMEHAQMASPTDNTQPFNSRPGPPCLMQRVMASQALMPHRAHDRLQRLRAGGRVKCRIDGIRRCEVKLTEGQRVPVVASFTLHALLPS